MHDNQSLHVEPREFIAWLHAYRWRWFLPLATVVGAAIAFAFLKPAEWDASQALTIRNEAANNEEGPGKFGHSEERRTAQETVLELAKSRVVLAAALAAAGPFQKRKDASAPWPTEREVDDFRESVTLAPPKGAELGRTEVFYLTVRDRDRQRAVKLVEAVRQQLEKQYQQVRDATAKSMSVELKRAVEMARKNLEEATARVAVTEAEVGEDLGDLRMLHQAISGETSLQRTATQIRNELRQVQNSRHSSEALIGLLKEAQKDPQRLVATPNRLIQSQPGLRQLKQGLVEAQLRTASLLGQMSEAHPAVIAARESEQEVRRNIHAELAEAISGLELELELQGSQEETLDARLADLDQRLAKLASLRAAYGSSLAEVANRAELLRQAEDDLAQAEASQAGADAASLIGRLDDPTVGTLPAGPGRKTIVAVGIVAGLLLGFGLLVLTAPMPGSEWEAGAGSPEVVVVVDSPSSPPVLSGEDGETFPTPSRRGATKSNLPLWQDPSLETEVLASVRDDVRMPERDLCESEGSGMTLKDALKRVGSV